MIRGYVAILTLVFGILTSSPFHTKDSFAEQNMLTAEGKISAIDTFKSTVTVKSLLVYPIITYKDFNLFIGPNTKIMYKGSPISIFDLVMGSPVDVKYVDKDDVLEALLITVTK